jgi:hypothetical protein
MPLRDSDYEGQMYIAPKRLYLSKPLKGGTARRHGGHVFSHGFKTVTPRSS